MRNSLNLTLYVIILFAFLAVFSSCGESIPTSTITQATEILLETPIPTITMTPVPPTATPIPMAAFVNGVGITMDEFEAELERYRSAQENTGSKSQGEAEKIVLEDLISQILLAQGAEKNGFEMDEGEFQSRLSELVAAAGGEDAFATWLQGQGFSEESFEIVLERSIKGAWMRDQILEGVPRSAEQVYVRQILLYNSEQASEALTEIESGRDFATVAASYDPITQGDLGWFPRNFLLHSSIEEAAFTLEPGVHSQVIETSVGYHIIQVVEKEPDRPLSPEALLIWQENALRDWVAMQREQSDIIIVSLQ